MVAPTWTDAMLLLRDGDMQVEGALVEASNTTLRVILTVPGRSARAVYKPIRGERPLWDFPEGTLAGREVAAYQVSKALGWELVPPTVMRDGPYGAGSCQLWLDDLVEPPVGFVPDTELPEDWLPVAVARDDDGKQYLLAHADDEALARMALFDALVNNADRKGGHILATTGGHLYGVDHGICFHSEDKLRTVLWGFAGRPIPQPLLAELARLEERELAEWLAPAELAAFSVRVQELVTRGHFPQPPDDRHAIPWPPI